MSENKPVDVKAKEVKEDKLQLLVENALTLEDIDFLGKAIDTMDSVEGNIKFANDMVNIINKLNKIAQYLNEKKQGK